jgi:hypothetical protein
MYIAETYPQIKTKILKYIILKKNIMKFLKIELDNLEEKERCL